MVATWPKPVWLVMACAAFVAQVAPRAWSGECYRGCCAAQKTDCCAATIVPRMPTSRVAPAAAETGCPLCAAASTDRLADADESPCHCRLDAKQDQSLVLHEARSPQRDDLSVWGVVADSTSLGGSRGLSASPAYAVASRAIPIRPMRILYGVWRN